MDIGNQIQKGYNGLFNEHKGILSQGYFYN